MPNTESITIERDYSAPPARVFAAWTNADKLKTWAWGSLAKEPTATIDLRVGGSYEITTQVPDGDDWRVFGKYEEIIPDKRLAYTVAWSAPMGYDSDCERVTVEFQPTDVGTRMQFTHSGLPAVACEEHDKGWRNTFDHLDQLLKETP